MNHDLWILTITAGSLGFIHTVLGPDHYIPFVAMSKSGRWKFSKTILITFLCGLGHIMSSVLLGFVGIALGIAVSRLEFIEANRGELAAWFLIAFGLVYLIWGLKQAIRNRPHEHAHIHSDGNIHTHRHQHDWEHAHAHENHGAMSMTPWILFTIFVFGPCEPLIPIVMYPAAQHNIFGVVWVTLVFGFVTIGTMLSIVCLSLLGINLMPIRNLDRYVHALAGGSILLCGLSVKFLGL